MKRSRSSPLWKCILISKPYLTHLNMFPFSFLLSFRYLFCWILGWRATYYHPKDEQRRSVVECTQGTSNTWSPRWRRTEKKVCLILLCSIMVLMIASPWLLIPFHSGWCWNGFKKNTQVLPAYPSVCPIYLSYLSRCTDCSINGILFISFRFRFLRCPIFRGRSWSQEFHGWNRLTY